MTEPRMPTARKLLPWIAAWGVLELAVAGLSGAAVTTLAAPVTGAWPAEERFYGLVETLARNPDLIRAAVLVPGLGGLLLAALFPAFATLFLSHLGQVPGRPRGIVFAAMYLQGFWHLLLLAAGLVAARLFLGAWLPTTAAGLGVLVAAFATVAHDFTRCRVVSGVDTPLHPRWATAGYREAWRRPGRTFPAVLLRLAQCTVALAILVVSLHGLGEPTWRWLARAGGLFGAALGLVRMAWIQRGAAAALDPQP